MTDQIAIPPSFVLTPTGLEAVGAPSFEDWKACGTALVKAEKAVQWAIGDWLNYGEKRYGEKYKEAQQVTGLGYQALRDIKWVAATYELSSRKDSVSFTAHKHLASAPSEDRQELLERAAVERLSTREIRDLVKRDVPRDAEPQPTQTTDGLRALVTQGRKFGCIMADPPWRYSNTSTRGAAEDHYGTMTVDELCELPVGDLAADKSHLWLWTTNAFLFDCPRLFEAWGFVFKCSYVWVKPQMGMGNYLRNSHELLLLAVRGGLVGAVHNVMSWGEFDRTKHSAKPEEIRARVVEPMSPGPRLEMFGRKVVPGWTVWGNQIAPDDTLFAEPVEHITEFSA